MKPDSVSKRNIIKKTSVVHYLNGAFDVIKGKELAEGVSPSPQSRLKATSMTVVKDQEINLKKRVSDLAPLVHIQRDPP